MKINWFTVIAQVINFLVLVWLLKRFLYKPILKATDEREKSIKDQLQDASAKQAEAEKERNEFTGKNEAFEQEKQKLMEKAISETTEQREQMLDEARKAAAALRQRQEKNLRHMEENLKKELAQRTGKEVLNISRQVLQDLASAALEEQVVKNFIEKLKSMDEVQKKAFLDAYSKSSRPLVIKSAFPLAADLQTSIKSAVQELLNENIDFEFGIDESITGGIELSANGYHLSWSISSYLAALEENVSKALIEEVEQQQESLPAQKEENDSRS